MTFRLGLEMAIVFSYAVLMAVPDPSRGERVNVGIFVFLPGRIDIRIAEIAKLRALTGRNWEDYSREMSRQLADKFSAGEVDKEYWSTNPQIDRVFRVSSIAAFSVNDEVEYEGRVKEILSMLVMKPEADQHREKTTRINTEITRHLRRLKALARDGETEETHKVFRNLPINDGLKADFWQKNGVMRVTSTVDFRRAEIDIREAALKSLVLDQAEKKYGHETKRLGVYAARKIDEDTAKPYIHLLDGYADEIFNWESMSDRQRYGNLALSVMEAPGPLL